MPWKQTTCGRVAEPDNRRFLVQLQCEDNIMK